MRTSNPRLQISHHSDPIGDCTDGQQNPGDTHKGEIAPAPEPSRWPRPQGACDTADEADNHDGNAEDDNGSRATWWHS